MRLVTRVLSCALLVGCGAEYGVNNLEAPTPADEAPIVDPVDPATPVDPTDPEQPTDPVDPVDPANPAAPTASILEPTGPVAALTGEVVVFVGRAADADSDRNDLAVTWHSSVDGVLGGAWVGTDEFMVQADLSVGSHVITFRVQDETGAFATDTVSITVSQPAPPAEAQPGDLVFSELMINPEVVDDENGEWVELYNTAGYPIDVAGYSFHDLDYDAWVLTGPFVVPAHGYFVMCAEMDPALNGGVQCDGWFSRVSLGGGLALANSPDEVVLTRPDGVEIDRLEYTADWFTTAMAVGVDPQHLDQVGNDDMTVWCDQVSIVAGGGEPGTPGLPNDPCF
jgi:hypothetical protein